MVALLALKSSPSVPPTAYVPEASRMMLCCASTTPSAAVIEQSLCPERPHGALPPVSDTAMTRFGSAHLPSSRHALPAGHCSLVLQAKQAWSAPHSGLAIVHWCVS